MGRRPVDRGIRRGLGRFASDHRGAAAVLFALMLTPVLLASGAAVDFARVGMLKASLQSVTDGAALAGASALSLSSGTTDATAAATDYFTKGSSPLARFATISSPTVTEPSSVEVTVTATATVNYSLMRLLGANSTTISVSSSAEGPAYQIVVTKTGGFTSSAYDSNSIYFYTVAADGAVPTSTSSMTLLFTNSSSVDANYATDNAESKNVAIGANDSVGFALVNITGGNTAYGTNGYGAKQGSTHYFYSSLTSPSMDAYPSPGTFYTGEDVTKTTTTTTGSGKNKKTTTTTTTSCQTTAITGTVTSYVPTASSTCYPHPCTEVSGSKVYNNNLLVGSSESNIACSSETTATLTCLQLEATPMYFYWNDMGGGSDDYDYNDADYEVTCKPTDTSAAAVTTVRLVK